MKSVAIIGAGYTGMVCAKKLLEQNCQVTIFEEQDEVGGMARAIIRNGYVLDKHYRHIFKSDTDIINLIEEMGVKQDLQWLETKMAYASEEGLYEFGTPLSLLKYKPLSFVQKIKFGLSIIYLKNIKNNKNLERYTIKEWFKEKKLEDIYQKVWEPLLNGKFQNKKDEVSMIWLWGKINLRSSCHTLKGEKLGYLMGGWKKLNDRLQEYLLQNKCDIRLGEKVVKVYKNNYKYVIETKQNQQKEYDEVVSTLSYQATGKIIEDMLTEEEKEKIKQMKYMAAKTLLIICKKQITPYYWVNIGDEKFPFVGIIEHTNMVDKSNYNLENIIYLSNYLEEKNPMYIKKANELLDLYFPYLKKMNPSIELCDIIEAMTFEEVAAQPVITTNYEQQKLEDRLESGIYIANMAQIYPEDRGMNYAIKLGYKIASLITEQANDRN